MSVPQVNRGTGGQPPVEEPGSLGEIISDISAGLSELFRREVDLAKAELKAEASKAGKAAGLFSGAGVAGLLTAIMLSFALAFGLGNVMDLGWASLIVAVIWAIIGAVMFVVGRNRARTVSPVPQQTVETLKEDAKWLKNPTSSGTTSK